MNTKRVGIVGCGQMGGALARAFSSDERLDVDLMLYDGQQDKLTSLCSQCSAQAASGARELWAWSELGLLAVKPQDMGGLLSELGAMDAQPRVAVSIAAGYPLARLRQALGGRISVVRAMPNRPALVKAGVTALMGDASTDEQALEEVEQLFRAAGETLRLSDEGLFDAITALSGSGPAFVFRFIEGLVAGSERLGLTREVATFLAIESVYGAAKLLRESGSTAAAEREAVSSPGGTTVAGLEVLRAHGFGEAIEAAIRAASERSKELGQ